ncbi:hypothetical protein BKA82DRAFT_20294 [Pisolithus tinctorius]|nr:hypothetical protein BKA82DRAFT_20294 [Pisolithus tinctorius]
MVFFAHISTTSLALGAYIVLAVPLPGLKILLPKVPTMSHTCPMIHRLLPAAQLRSVNFSEKCTQVLDAKTGSGLLSMDPYLAKLRERPPSFPSHYKSTSPDEQSFTNPMAAIEHYWAVIGGPHSSVCVYGSDDCPLIPCGRATSPLPVAIQCKSENEARRVAGMLQGIVNSLPHGADHTQILAAFNIPSVRTLLEDEAGFYAIVIGSPPGIHRTVESAKRAEGSFKYPICRHTPSFWLALAFVIVKGVPQHMPPLEIVVEVPESPIDTLGKRLRDSLHISPQTPQTASAFTSRASSSATSTSSTRLETATSDAEPSPIIYSHRAHLVL